MSADPSKPFAGGLGASGSLGLISDAVTQMPSTSCGSRMESGSSMLLSPRTGRQRDHLFDATGFRLPILNVLEPPSGSGLPRFTRAASNHAAFYSTRGVRSPSAQRAGDGAALSQYLLPASRTRSGGRASVSRGSLSPQEKEAAGGSASRDSSAERRRRRRGTDSRGGAGEDRHAEVHALKEKFESNMKWIASQTERLLSTSLPDSHDVALLTTDGSQHLSSTKAGASTSYLDLRGQFGSAKERRDYFRFHKKIEPKLIPLKTDTLCPQKYMRSLVVSPRRNAVMRNTSSEYLNSFKLLNRREKFLRQGEELEERIAVRQKWKRQRQSTKRLNAIEGLRRKELHYPVLGSRTWRRGFDEFAWERESMSRADICDDVLKKLITFLFAATFLEKCDALREDPESEVFLTQIRAAQKEKRRMERLEGGPDTQNSAGASDPLRPPGESTTDEEASSEQVLKRQVARLQYLRFKMALRMVVRNKRGVREARILYASFYKRTKLLQAWWRGCRALLKKKLAYYLKRITSFEMRYHRQVFIDRHGGACTPPSAQMVRALLIPEPERRVFLSLELRARRYLSITALNQYRADYRDYEKQVDQWRAQRQAARLMGSEVEMMPFPPAYPICYPADKELRDLVERYMAIYMARAMKRQKPVHELSDEEMLNLFNRNVKELAEKKPPVHADEDDGGGNLDSANEVSLETLFMVRLRLDESPAIMEGGMLVAPSQEVKGLKYNTLGRDL
eukprot:g17133.t1